VAQGAVTQLTLSHDAGVLAHGLELASSRPWDDFGYIGREFLPRLRRAGLAEADIRTMLVTNPQRVLAFA